MCLEEVVPFSNRVIEFKVELAALAAVACEGILHFAQSSTTIKKNTAANIVQAQLSKIAGELIEESRSLSCSPYCSRMPKQWSAELATDSKRVVLSSCKSSAPVRVLKYLDSCDFATAICC